MLLASKRVILLAGPGLSGTHKGLHAESKSACATASTTQPWQTYIQTQTDVHLIRTANIIDGFLCLCALFVAVDHGSF